MKMFKDAPIGNLSLGVAGLILLSSGCASSIPSASTTPLTVIYKSPTVIEVLTLTITSTTTPTPRPTLSKESKQELILGLMATNGGCSLPCWWGITPGKTTWIEAKNLLESESFAIGEPAKYNGLNVYGIRGGLDLYNGKINIYESFGESDGIVKNITLRAGGFDEDRFRSVFRNYSVQQVLLLYGRPSRIMLQSHAQFDSRSNIGYGLWLFYDQLGFLLKYSGAIASGKIYHVCPKLDDEGNVKTFDIYLASPDNPRYLEDLSDYSDYQNGYIYPIEELGIPVDDFYKSFLKSNSACLDIPSDKYKNP